MRKIWNSIDMEFWIWNQLNFLPIFSQFSLQMDQSPAGSVSVSTSDCSGHSAFAILRQPLDRLPDDGAEQYWHWRVGQCHQHLACGNVAGGQFGTAAGQPVHVRTGHHRGAAACVTFRVRHTEYDRKQPDSDSGRPNKVAVDPLFNWWNLASDWYYNSLTILVWNRPTKNYIKQCHSCSSLCSSSVPTWSRPRKAIVKKK